MQVAYVEQVTKAEYIGKQNVLDKLITGFSTDTRSVNKGDLFIAVKGERVDGHHFLQEAFAKGAIAALVSEKMESDLPQLLVQDTVKALGLLAHAHRMQFNLPILALTGSCGKTTVKEMIASILSVRGAVLATKGNLNTEIGVPLTLLRLNKTHQYAVIEMGARHPGDISYLTQLTEPQMSLITNAGVAHKEIFGGEESIAKAKGEIFEQLIPNGIAIMNLDDKNIHYWKGLINKQKLITFGVNPEANISCQDIVLNPLTSSFILKTDIGQISVQMSVAGQHNVQNALAAAAAARAMNIDLQSIAQGLKQFSAVSGRLQFKLGKNACTIIDDSYNANPTSMEAALKVLAGCSTQKIAVIGNMFELGSDALALHYKMGKIAKDLKIDKLFGLGDLSKAAVDAFGEGANHYMDKENLINDLLPYIKETNTILVKGSRGMRMEEIVSALTDVQETHLC